MYVRQIILNVRQKITEEDMRGLVTVVLMSLSISLSAAGRYYVSNAGNDNYDGKSEATAWKTIAKVNAQKLLAGDTVSFKCGDIWRETLTIPASGTNTQYIVFNTYGSGEKPMILGSVSATSWENQGGNIWKSSTSIPVDPYVSSSFRSEIFFYETDNSINWGVRASGVSSLAKEYDWIWSGGYVYVYSATDPDSKYAKVEVPQRNNCIQVGNYQYIEVDGFDLRHAKNINVYDNDPETSLTGFTIQNCIISYVGSREQANGYNLSVCRNNLLIRNNEIFEGGRRQISVHIYDADNLTFSGITIDGNICHDGYHGSGFGIAMDGSRVGNRFENIVVKNNLFYDRTTRNPAIDGWDPSSFGALRAGETGSSIANVEIYNNVFMYPNTYALSITNVQNATVYNNTFYDFNHNTTTTYSYHVLVGEKNTGLKIKNNIFYGTQSYSITGKTMSVVIESGQDLSQMELNYNLFYENDTYMTMVQVQGTNYRSTNWSSIKTDRGWQINEPGLLNPKFVSAPDNLHITETSPARGAGLDVNIPTDHDGVKYPDPPSIGAYEYASGSVTPTAPVFKSAVIENATPSRIDMTYSMTLADITPSATAFKVMVNSVERTVTNVSVSGTSVKLTLASAVVYGDVVTVAYTKPATNPLQATDGTEAASMTAKSVTNNVGAPAPMFVSASVENATPSRINITFSLSLASVTPAVSSFTVLVNSSARTVTAVYISGTSVQLTLSSPVVYGDLVTVAYAQPSTNPLQSTAGARVATFTARSVANNVNPATPVFVSASVETTTPSQIDMIFSIALTSLVPSVSAFRVVVNSSDAEVSSVSVSGNMVYLTLVNPIKYGDVVSVAYTKPATYPLQTSEGATVSTFSLKSVTNNVAATESKSTSMADISLYPVPAVDHITIDIKEEYETPLTLRIYNMAGRLSMTVIIEPGTQNLYIPLNLKTGSYLVQVLNEGATIYTQKLSIKNK